MSWYHTKHLQSEVMWVNSQVQAEHHPEKVVNFQETSRDWGSANLPLRTSRYTAAAGHGEDPWTQVGNDPWGAASIRGPADQSGRCVLRGQGFEPVSGKQAWAEYQGMSHSGYSTREAPAGKQPVGGPSPGGGSSWENASAMGGFQAQ